MTTYHRVSHQGAHPFNPWVDPVDLTARPGPSPSKPPRKPGWFRWLLACLIALGVILTIGVIASAGTATGAFAPHNGPGMSVGVAAGEAASAPPWVAPTQKPAAKPSTAPVLGEGTWEVPGEVKPGTYTTTADHHCYWARLSSFDGSFDAIITNGNLDPGARGRLTVKKTDKGLDLRGSCQWKRAG